MITPDLKPVLIYLSFLSLLLIPMGITLLVIGSNLNTYNLRYDDKCFARVCTLNFTLPYSLHNPKVYYEIDGFYFSHKDFLNSQSYE